MFDDENQFHSGVFKKNNFNDPFREENFMFENTQKEPENESQTVFKLHLEQKEGEHKEKKQEKIIEQKPTINPEEEKTWKTVLKDASRQIIASLIILVIGFLALNWSAYYQIAKSKWEDFTGTKQESPLTQFVEEPENEKSVTTLKTGENVEQQKKQIPELNLEIAPPDNRIIIPRIDKNLPIVRVSSENLIKRDWKALEKDMQEALKNGVVHYPGTSLPGETGNVVITGHSSYFPWDPGRFKDVFALLHDVVLKDKIVVYYNQTKYIYEVENIQIVYPQDIDILKQTPDNKLTLITCTPVGTNLKRLVVTAKPVSKEISSTETILR